GSAPTTRFRTALAADGCTKRVVSPAPIENCCQLMIAPGLLVMERRPPFVENAAWPLTTTGPVGLAYARCTAQPAAATAMIQPRPMHHPPEQAAFSAAGRRPASD